jgi:ABC-type uncharacterized transport system ATPase component
MGDGKVLNISETYLIGIDISLKDEPVMTVIRRNGPKNLTLVNTIVGEEAKSLYEKLTNK